MDQLLQLLTKLNEKGLIDEDGRHLNGHVSIAFLTRTPWLVKGPLEGPTPNRRLRKILRLLDIQEILIVVSNVAEEVIHNLRQEAENCTIEMDVLTPESTSGYTGFS